MNFVICKSIALDFESEIGFEINCVIELCLDEFVDGFDDDVNGPADSNTVLKEAVLTVALVDGMLDGSSTFSSIVDGLDSGTATCFVFKCLRRLLVDPPE